MLFTLFKVYYVKGKTHWHVHHASSDYLPLAYLNCPGYEQIVPGLSWNIAGISHCPPPALTPACGIPQTASLRQNMCKHHCLFCCLFVFLYTYDDNSIMQSESSSNEDDIILITLLRTLTAHRTSWFPVFCNQSRSTCMQKAMGQKKCGIMYMCMYSPVYNHDSVMHTGTGNIKYFPEMPVSHLWITW